MSCRLRAVTLFALLLVAATANGQTLETPRREGNIGIYALEAGGATVGALLGFGLGMGTAFALWMSGTSEDQTMLPAALVGVPATIAGCAGGAYLMGSAFQQEGQYLPTLCWSTGGLAAGAALVIGGTQIQNSDIQVGTVNQIGYYTAVVGYLVLLATPEITTYGYNRSRPPDSYGSRFVPGSAGLASVRDAEGVAHPSLNVRLLTVRF